MSKKKFSAGIGGIVFSTNPDFKIQKDGQSPDETLLPEQQMLKVRLDNKQRRGKSVTLIEGFSGKETDREDLGKKIKAFCGTGGSVKEGVIIIQGDQKEKVIGWLVKNGFKLAKKS